MHRVNRVFAILDSAYFGWTLRSHINSRGGSCGSVHVAGHGYFANVENLHIGDNVHINAEALWICSGGVTIGDNTIFARRVTIYSRNHNYQGQELPFDHSNIARPVKIGANVWIGAGVTILPGADIGEGAIIGAGSVIAGRVPAKAIYGAPPAHHLKDRDEKHYAHLVEEGCFHKPRYPLAALRDKWRGR